MTIAALTLTMVGTVGAQTATISGEVYCDQDRDGTLDPGEPPVDAGNDDGITMGIFCDFFPSGLFFVDFTETDLLTGEYSFEVPFLIPGETANCFVGIEPPSQLDPFLEPTTPIQVGVSVVPGQVVTGVDFGTAVRDVLIGDRVWEDLDADGTLDAGETGLGGVVVDADCTDADGNVLDLSSTTDSNGFYEIAAPCITPVTMDCTVSVDPAQLPQYVPSTPTSLTYLGLLPGETVSDADFGFEPVSAAKVSGDVFCDADGDGTLDIGDPGIGAVEVSLDCTISDGTFEMESTTTDPDGSYEFCIPIPEGETADCEVAVEPDAVDGKEPTTPTEIRLDGLVSGDGSTANDFGFAEVSVVSISGSVFEDLDLDGFFEPGEPGFAAFPVDLVCQLSDGPTIVQTASTAVDGTYQLLFLIRIGVMASCEVSVDPNAFAGATPMLLPTTPTTVALDLIGGDMVDGVDFGYGDFGPKNRPPECESAAADPDLIWPPNHKFVAIAIVDIVDPDGDPVTVEVTAITQDEPLETTGDGNFEPDATLVDGQAEVRAERSGNLNGRVYQLTFVATDGEESCTGTVQTCVPHDRNSPCIDDGQLYDSLGSGEAPAPEEPPGDIILLPWDPIDDPVDPWIPLDM